MNATNNLMRERLNSSMTLPAISSLDTVDYEQLEATKRLLAVPFFIITFSATALLTLSLNHASLSEQQHNTVVASTLAASLAMLLGVFPCIKAGNKTLLIYSVVSAMILGILAPLGW